MVEKFNSVPAKERGKIYDYQLNLIKQLYYKYPEAAGELAIAVLEKTLTGQSSNNDPVVNSLVEVLTKEKKV